MILTEMYWYFCDSLLGMFFKGICFIIKHIQISSNIHAYNAKPTLFAKKDNSVIDNINLKYALYQNENNI